MPASIFVAITLYSESNAVFIETTFATVLQATDNGLSRSPPRVRCNPYTSRFRASLKLCDLLQFFLILRAQTK